MISLLVCSRISGNENWSLLNLLESIKRRRSNHKKFEVLVTFDSDDKRVSKVLPKLDTYPVKIKHIIEPRGRGYVDLHVFYDRLFSQVDERSVVIGAMADDFEIIQDGWDEIILSKANTFQDQIFIVHGRPHPPTSREKYNEQKFYLDFDINNLEELHIIDEAPLWSRRLLNVCGGFGHLSFTDAWTLCLEYFLFHRFGINRTIFLEQPIVHRKTKEKVDQQIALRWWTDRADNFAFARSGFYKTLIEQQALNIYCNIKMSELPSLPPSLVQKNTDFNPVLSAHSSIPLRKQLGLLFNSKKTACKKRAYEFVVSRPWLKSLIKRILTSS